MLIIILNYIFKIKRWQNFVCRPFIIKGLYLLFRRLLFLLHCTPFDFNPNSQYSIVNRKLNVWHLQTCLEVVFSQQMVGWGLPHHCHPPVGASPCGCPDLSFLRKLRIQFRKMSFSPCCHYRIQPKVAI